MCRIQQEIRTLEAYLTGSHARHCRKPWKHRETQQAIHRIPGRPGPIYVN